MKESFRFCFYHFFGCCEAKTRIKSEQAGVLNKKKATNIFDNNLDKFFSWVIALKEFQNLRFFLLQWQPLQAQVSRPTMLKVKKINDDSNKINLVFSHPKALDSLNFLDCTLIFHGKARKCWKFSSLFFGCHRRKFPSRKNLMSCYVDTIFDTYNSRLDDREASLEQFLEWKSLEIVRQVWKSFNFSLTSKRK